MKGWHFLPADGKHRYDKRTPKQGETLSIPDDQLPVLCDLGMHASKRLIDALQYAPGPLIQRVDIAGDLDLGDDKFCGRHRTTLAGPVDATDILRRFARLCALDVVHLWDPPKIVVQYLKTGDESIMAAAREAARDAAWAAAWAAARDAARAAAGAATWGSTWDAARAAARTKQNQRLTSMISALLKKEAAQC